MPRNRRGVTREIRYWSESTAIGFIFGFGVIMGIVVIGVVAYLFDLLMRWLERRLVPWKGRM